MTTSETSTGHSSSNDGGMHVTPSTAREPDRKDEICRTAPDREKCEAFLDRLAEAAENIDRRA